MGVTKNFIDEFAKHKMLIYFAILFGVSMFFWSIFDLIDHVGQMNILGIIHNLLNLGAGIFLTIFGIKFLNPNFLETMDKEKMLVYFLMLWAGSFFFLGLHKMVWNGQWMADYLDHILAFLSGAADFFAGAVLGLFAWNILNEKEPSTT